MTTLDQNELLDLAMKFSRENLRDFGEVPPTLLAATPDGIVVFNPESLSNGDDMKQFALIAQLVAVSFCAQAVAIILHAWWRCSTEPKIPERQPIQSPYLREAVLVCVESPSTAERRLLSIRRDAAGTFVDFDADDAPFDEMQAPFAGIYSSEALADMRAETARELLKCLGIEIA